MSLTSIGAPALAPAAIDEHLRRRIAGQLAGQFKGDIIGPDHDRYPAARRVWNSMVDRRPGLILRCTSTEDVVAAVTAARANGLPPAVPCAGPSGSAQALPDPRPTI